MLPEYGEVHSLDLECCRESTAALKSESGRHLSAFLRALAARVRATFAMLVFVFRAFLRARITDIRADSADPSRKLTAARHQPYGESADIRAIAVQFDAAGHHLHVLLVQAFGCAVLASDRAGDARMDATLVFLM
jgi:hypothetical protein